MNPADARAVFLSYASQDAEAARRICDALRAAGVEVWFDQSELRGGDAWDAKIRKQIRECALFVPVISANTNARPEGYFRLEWKLAVDRSHLMADDQPFIVPVVIDETPESAARVPDKFREVQWTRLVLTESPAAFAGRMRKLLGEGATESNSPARGRHGDEIASRGRRARRPSWPLVVLGGFAIFVAGVVAFFALRPKRSPEEIAAALAKVQSIVDSAKKLAPGESRSATPPAAKTPAEQLIERARSRRIESRDELLVAADLARRATELAPDSARAWASRAWLEGQYIQRGWDISEQRRQDTQAFAKRALAIDPDVTDAMYALAIVLSQQGAHAQVEALMRRAIALNPNDAELRLALGVALSGQGREADALAVRQETLRLFPQDPLAHYDLALSHEHAPTPDFEAALKHFEDSIALQPFTSTILHKASLLAGWKGDLPAARQLLNGLPPLERTGDRAVGIAMILGLLEHQPARTIEAGELTARTYLEDDYVRGPKAWLLAHAYALAGKPSLAQAQWREAEAVLRQRMQAAPGGWFEEAGLGVTLAWSGATAEAARIMAPLESVARESPQASRTLYLAYYHAGLGDAASAAANLRPILNRRELLTDKTLPLDPWWDKVRDQAEFRALGSEAAAPRANR